MQTESHLFKMHIKRRTQMSLEFTLRYV